MSLMHENRLKTKKRLECQNIEMKNRSLHHSLGYYHSNLNQSDIHISQAPVAVAPVPVVVRRSYTM